MPILRIRDPFVCILYCVVVSFNSREFIFSCVFSIIISFISTGVIISVTVEFLEYICQERIQ
jgi:hypothetical protein